MSVSVLEVTLRTLFDLRAIEAIATHVEGALVGVGTITRPEDVGASLNTGARFGVSPGLTPALIDAAHASRLSPPPGAMTPSHVIAARAAGYTELKLFLPSRLAGSAC